MCLPLLRMCLSDVPLSLSSRALIMTCARRSEDGVNTKPRCESRAAWAKSEHLLTRPDAPSGRRLKRAVGPPASRPTEKALRLRRQLLRSSLLPPLKKSACRAILILRYEALSILQKPLHYRGIQKGFVPKAKHGNVRLIE